MYKVFVRELDEIRGRGIMDVYSIKEAREEIEGMEFPEGSFVYIRYGRPGWHGGKRPSKDVEAYKVEGGQLVRIFSRYKGGEWPASYSLTSMEREEINKEIEGVMGEAPSRDVEALLDYFKERRSLSRKLGKDIREESRIRWLEERAGKTYPMAAEEPQKFSRLRQLLGGLGAEPEERDEVLREFGKRI